MIITVDGPAGSGKSTTAKLLAKKLGAVFMDTGAMYRSVTLVALSSGNNVNNENSITSIAREISISFEDGENGQKTFINGVDKTADIRSKEIDANVSTVASYKGVREAMVALQRRIALSGKTVVTEGRDTGSVVFPHADFKFYLDASPETRARRRAEERGEKVDEEQVREITERDKKDSNRKESPLKIPEGSHVIDNSNFTIDETLQKIIQFIS